MDKLGVLLSISYVTGFWQSACWVRAPSKSSQGALCPSSYLLDPLLRRSISSSARARSRGRASGSLGGDGAHVLRGTTRQRAPRHRRVSRPALSPPPHREGRQRAFSDAASVRTPARPCSLPQSGREDTSVGAGRGIAPEPRRRPLGQRSALHRAVQSVRAGCGRTLPTAFSGTVFALSFESIDDLGRHIDAYESSCAR